MGKILEWMNKGTEAEKNSWSGWRVFEAVTVYSSVIEQPDSRHLNQMLNMETSATDLVLVFVLI